MVIPGRQHPSLFYFIPVNKINVHKNVVVVVVVVVIVLPSNNESMF